jgi:hypothetical protein
MDELPPEYKVTENNPKPPLLTYGIPVEMSKVVEYGRQHESERANFRKPILGMLAIPVLSKHVQYPLRLGFPTMLTTDYGAVMVLYTNYDVDKAQLIEEDEEDVIAMVKEALKVGDDVRPRWYFDERDPFVPQLGDD